MNQENHFKCHKVKKHWITTVGTALILLIMSSPAYSVQANEEMTLSNSQTPPQSEQSNQPSQMEKQKQPEQVRVGITDTADLDSSAIAPNEERPNTSLETTTPSDQGEEATLNKELMVEKSLEQEVSEESVEAPTVNEEIQNNISATDSAETVPTEKQGFYQEGNQWYYRDENGKNVTGWQDIDNQKLYFNEDGSQVKGETHIEPGHYITYHNLFVNDSYNIKQVDDIYYFDPDTGDKWTNRFVYTNYTDGNGKSHQGWFYLNHDGKATIGWKEIDGKKYYFDVDGVQVKGKLISTDGNYAAYYQEEGQKSYLDPNTGQAWSNQFAKVTYRLYNFAGSVTANAWIYLNNDGIAVTGWQTINGADYYFNQQSFQVKGNVAEKDNKTYFLDADNGQIVYNQFGTIPAKRISTAEVLPEKTYYFGQDGSRWEVTGWQNIDGINYFFNDDFSISKNTFAVIDENTYYFNSNGHMVRNSFEKNENQYPNPWYYLGTDGKAVSGWLQLNNTKYYFRQEDDNKGQQVKGTLMDIDGKKYYFDPNDGSLWTNRSVKYNGFIYQLDGNGQASDITDNKAYFSQEGNYIYYVDETGKKVTGLHTIKGNHYYFDESGVLQKGKLLRFKYDTLASMDGPKSYDWWSYADFYYFDKENGAALKNQFVLIDGKNRYFGDDGKLLKNSLVTVNDKIYKIGYDGAASSYTLLWEEDDSYYTFDQAGVAITNQFITMQDKKTYYFGKDGKALIGYQTIEGHSYYFQENAALLKGSGFDNNKKLILTDSETGEIIADHFQPNHFYEINKNWYYIDADKKYVTGWQNIGGKKYYFKNDGVQVKGVSSINGDYYYFDQDTGEPWTNRFFQHSYWYYAGHDGKPLTGWQTINGKQLYFHSNGIQAKGKIVEEQGNLYYFDKETGELWTNRELIYNRYRYHIDDKGRATILGPEN